jgi:hypothetical protein
MASGLLTFDELIGCAESASQSEPPDLLQAYTDEVIGGPGAFALTCQDYPAFASAMKQKLTREINAPIV